MPGEDRVMPPAHIVVETTEAALAVTIVGPSAGALQHAEGTLRRAYGVARRTMEIARKKLWPN